MEYLYKKVNGWLIYNGALTSEKFLEINDLYLKAAQNKSIELTLIKNNEIYSLVENNFATIKINGNNPDPDFILFMDKDIRLAKQLENLGYRLFNSPKAIDICDDKIMTYQILANHDIRIPKTLFSPLIYEGTKEESEDFIKFAEKEFMYPVVVKEAFGSFGHQVYLVENREQLVAKREELLHKAHLYQEFIRHSKGKDVRLQVVGDRVVAAMYRSSDIDFRANLSNGGRMRNFEPPQEFIDMAVKATKIVGADFAGVDLLFGENDEPIICEVNSNAHIKNIYDCTGVDVAEHILEYILKKIDKE